MTVVVSTVVHIAVVAAWLALEEKPLARLTVAKPAPPAPSELAVVLIDLPPGGRGARASSRGRDTSRAGHRGSVPREVAPTGDSPPAPAAGPGATLAMRGRPALPTVPPGVSDEPGARRGAQIESGELVRQRDGSYRSDKNTFTARVDPDGKVHLKDKRNLDVHIEGLGLGGRFDVTDWAMRSRGIDPYASEKLRFLDRTRDQRVAIGKEYRRAQLAQSGMWMQRNIDHLWASTPDLAARKQGLFELWDDCAESGDTALVAGGAAARTVVINFIQLRLRGADAFTADEIARHNTARRSQAPFAPYD